MSNLDTHCINTIRVLSIDCVQRANSGHPGMPMGSATMAYVLWTRFLRHNPLNPKWPNRDRFILSAGHGSMLLYSLLYLTGYDLDLDELKNFRQWNSKTPGHPEYGRTPGVETTTGPLGQGFANGVGMAMAERYLSEYFNRPGFEIIDHHIFGIVSDGDLMEGISHESASLAGHLKLGKIVYLYDDNRITIDGSTDLSFTEDRMMRFEAYGWHTQTVEDGNNIEAIEEAIEEAINENERPSIIAIRTHIGYGSPNKQDTSSAHGEPLGEEEAKLTKINLGWSPDSECYVPEEVLKNFRKAVDKGKRLEEEWRNLLKEYKSKYPELGEEFINWINGELPDNWKEKIPVFQEDSKGIATRSASGKVLNAVAPVIKNLVGGSADLSPSNKTMIQGSKSFQADSYGGRNIHFGVREHAMAGIMNGMALHGGIRPYGGTFLVFSDYMRPSLRLSAMMELPIIYIFTHDSIGLGEDGPTHQPIEQLMSLRAIPSLVVIRPCDANETAGAWEYAIEHSEGPVALVLSRQSLPVLDPDKYETREGIKKGAYVLKESALSKIDAIIIASGSEVHIALESSKELEKEGLGIRVVSMPSWEIFEKQDRVYKESVLPPHIKARVAIEAGVPLGWERYVGERGEIIGIDHFGASAPYKVLYEKFKITSKEIIKKVKNILK